MRLPKGVVMNFGERGGQTVRITFRGKDGEPDVVLFGNSYKTWQQQMVEYVYRTYGNRDHGWRYADVEGRLLGVERSRSAWIGWGGLKWCSEDIFQEELNREGCQQGDPDNPRPRRYADFNFHPYPYGRRVAIKALKEY
jgi:hypothetical protein